MKATIVSVAALSAAILLLGVGCSRKAQTSVTVHRSQFLITPSDVSAASVQSGTNRLGMLQATLTMQLSSTGAAVYRKFGREHPHGFDWAIQVGTNVMTLFSHTPPLPLRQIGSGKLPTNGVIMLAMPFHGRSRARAIAYSLTNR